MSLAVILALSPDPIKNILIYTIVPEALQYGELHRILVFRDPGYRIRIYPGYEVGQASHPAYQNLPVGPERQRPGRRFPAYRIEKEDGSSGTPYLNIDQKIYISFRALGQDISQRQVFTYRIDPADGNFVYHDSLTEQGNQVVAAAMTVVGDSLYLQPEGQAAVPIYLPENTILPNTMFFSHLHEDFGTGGLDSSTYRIFNVRNGRVEEVVYHKVGVERIELNDTVY